MINKKHPDISHYVTIRNKDKFYSQCDFLITKATEGTSKVDGTLKEVISECEKRHIPYYLYSFLHRGEEVADVKFLIRTCAPLVGKHFRGYVIDVETNPLNGTEPTLSGVKKALKYIADKGQKCMIYTMYAQYDEYKSAIASRPKNCAWWEARYGANNGHDTHLRYPCHKGVDLHQYTSKGKMSGTEGDIDLNRRTGTKSLEWFTEAKKSAKKATSQTKYKGKLPDGKHYIKAGSKGIGVGYWQSFLKWRGYNLKVDGIFGEDTERCTKKFQKNHKLKADGIVGPKTVAEAKKYM